MLKKLKDIPIRRNPRLTKLLISAVLIALAGGTVYRITTLMESESKKSSTMENIVGGTGEMSKGYDHGNVYSIDGHLIAEDYTVGEQTKFCAVEGFSSIIGSDGCGGLIYKCAETLYSSDSKINRYERKGNSIQTTLSYKGQLTASSMLSQYFGHENCEGGSVSVVLADGAVLVAAGTNEYDPQEFFSETPPKDLYIDYCTVATPLGSVAKAVTARMLLLNDKNLSKEDSLYNISYPDLSFFTANGVTIHNWDYTYSGCYETIVDNGAYLRYINLAEALMRSSNTYFWRHALSFGLERSYNAEAELFGIGDPIVTELGTLDPVTVSRDRLDYYPWGQSFYCDSLRICELYNHILSGEAYIPYFVTSVRQSDSTEIYRVEPTERKELHFDIKKNDILIDALSQCFDYYAQGINHNITDRYRELIDNKRLLAKSGTADIDELKGTTNNTRMLCVLDENHNVVATACILIKNAQPTAPISDDLLFTILLETLEAADVI